MTEPTLYNSNQQTGGEASEATAQKAPIHFVEEGTFPRLQERILAQLGFINSLLITLAVGLLAFATNASANTSELNRLGWWKWILFIGFTAAGALGRLWPQARLQSARIASLRVSPGSVNCVIDIEHRNENMNYSGWADSLSSFDAGPWAV